MIVTVDTANPRINPYSSVIPNWAEGPVRNLLSFGVEMARERTYHVYIMASKGRVIYVGVTGFLMARVLRHRAGEGGQFTRKYRVHRLVYGETFHNVAAAIARETEIKKWRREKKVALIEMRNPTWEDLAEGWGEPAVMRVARTAGFLTGPSARFGMTKMKCKIRDLLSP